MISPQIAIFFFVVALALFLYSYVSMGRLKNGSQDWDAQKPELIKAWITVLSAMFSLSLGLFFFYRYAQGQDYFYWFTLAMAFTAFGLSYTAFLLTVMSK
jgi:hypothetical protein